MPSKEFEAVVRWISKLSTEGLLHTVESRPKIWERLNRAMQQKDPGKLTQALEKADFYGLLSDVWLSKHGDDFQVALTQMGRTTKSGSLQGRTVRLAYARKDLRPVLLPLLLRTASVSKRDIDKFVKIWDADMDETAASFSIPVSMGERAGRISVVLGKSVRQGKFWIRMQGPAGALPTIQDKDPRRIVQSLLKGKMEPLGEQVILGVIGASKGKQPMPPWEKRRRQDR